MAPSCKNIILSTKEIEVLHFLVSREFRRIAAESQAAFDNQGSWAERIDKLHNQLTFLRDSNLFP